MSKNKFHVFKTELGVDRFISEELAYSSYINSGSSPYCNVENHKVYTNVHGRTMLCFVFQCNDGMYRVLFPKKYNYELEQYYRDHDQIHWSTFKHSKIPFNVPIVAHCIIPKYAVEKKSEKYLTGYFKEFENMDWRFVSKCHRFTLDLDLIKRYIVL